MQILKTLAHSLQLYATVILSPLPMPGYGKFGPPVWMMFCARIFSHLAHIMRNQQTDAAC